MLVEKMLQFKLPAAHSVHFPAGEAQGFTPFRPPRACCPCGQGGDGHEEPMSQLHTCLEGKAIEISSSGEVGLWVWTTRSGVMSLAAAILTLAAAFFLGFPAAGLGTAVDLGSGFLGLAVFLMAVTLGYLGASVTG